jgi:hypothetical protein
VNSFLEDFISEILSIEESDYGDFMRLANLYLNQLRKDLSIYYDKNINKKIDEMQIYLQFTPKWEVESTRKRVLADANYLKELITAHNQDWESANL